MCKPSTITHRVRHGQSGFATAAVLFLLVIAVVAGGFMLKASKHRSATASNYFQARSASYSAQAGLEAALADFEAHPTEGMQRINNYLQNNNNAWLLGGIGNASSENWIPLGNGQQSYAAKIAAFDPSTRLVKLISQGRGPGGSESQVYGVFQMQGLQADQTTAPNYTWYMAGEARNLDAPIDVSGNAYFGGGLHANNGAFGSVFRGTLQIGPGSGASSSFDTKVTFLENALFLSPVKTQGGGMFFAKSVGFDADIFSETDIQLTGSGQTAYFNSDINGGNRGINLNWNNLVDNGSLNLARVQQAGSVTHEAGTIPLASRLGLPNATGQEISIDVSNIPPANWITLNSLGFAFGGNTGGNELSAAYLAAKTSGKLYKDFLCVLVNAGLNFNAPASEILSGKFFFKVVGPINVNGNFPTCDPTTVCILYVNNGGSVIGLGGSGLFRGYVNATGNSNVTYQWSPGAEFRGAIHHVSATTGFQLNNSGGPMKLVYDVGVFDDIAPLNVLVPPGASQPSIPTPRVKLVDTRIRPICLSRYF